MLFVTTLIKALSGKDYVFVDAAVDLTLDGEEAMNTSLRAVPHH